ncbi:hypothetical protein FSARC_14873 [Fusarium sarcochroum]|uniref:Ribosomal protein S21 n=1 Tax=Fusarium sarcochroum TaxID=1208366 RepID=A0A8H4WN09_9HYPO|nr:hypothetical protein FSARC_14873 [Fusarium sarcochroum]
MLCFGSHPTAWSTTANWATTLEFVCKMAASLRTGSAMLSRVSTPSTCRAFSTSLAVRAGPKIPTRQEAPPRVRANPLVGNVQRTPPTKFADPVDPKSTPETKDTPEAQATPPPPPPPAAGSAEGSKTGETDETKKHSYNAAKSNFSLDIASIIANKSNQFGAAAATDPATRPQIRAKPVTGRTVFVKDRITQTSGPTPVMALRILNRMVRDDHVKNKYHSQKFHERKGLKKKRLRSQRWRSRFKHGFKATVSRVIELKKQGW